MHKTIAQMNGSSFMSPSVNGRGHSSQELKGSLVSIFYSFHGVWAKTANAIAVGTCLRQGAAYWEPK